MTDTVRAGQREVTISHADRVVFPQDGLTKLDLARYYAAVAGAMVPLVRDRPLALQSSPHGVGGESYFVKNVPAHFPAWIATAEIPRREGGSIRQALANQPATLVYLAGQNMVTPHIWISRVDRLEQPDRIVFDLDPSVDRFAEVRAAARGLGALLRDLGLVPHAMTTGSRGVHVVVTIRRHSNFEQVHGFARDVAGLFASQHPDKLTVEFHRDRRGERIYIDVARDAYGQHAVAPYGVRGLPGAPVATPLHWKELDDPRLGPRSWSVATIPDRLAQAGDPWREIARDARALGPARRALDRLVA